MTSPGDVFQLLAKACLIYYPCEHTRVLILKNVFTCNGVWEVEEKGLVTKNAAERSAGTILHFKQDRDFFTGESSPDFRKCEEVFIERFVSASTFAFHIPKRINEGLGQES